MKIKFLLASILQVLCFLTTLNAQSPKQVLTEKVEGLNVVKVVVEKPKITLRCKTSDLRDTPLLVIDGTIEPLSKLSSLNPNNIEKIEILKSSAVTALYSSQAAYGMILIKTRSENFLWVKNSIDSSAVPYATITLKQAQSQNVIVADANGKISMKEFLKHGTYDISISSAGYKTQNFTIDNNRQDANLFLEPNTKAESVIMYAFSGRRGCGFGCRLSCWVKCDSLISTELLVPETDVFNFYPNPIRPGSTGYLEIDNQNISDIQISTMTGQTVWRQQIGQRDKNRIIQVPISIQWKPGAYVLQVVDAKGGRIQSTKVIIQ